jgi:hypothetical protein
LGGWPGALDHVLRDTGLSDLKAELEQGMEILGPPLSDEEVRQIIAEAGAS